MTITKYGLKHNGLKNQKLKVVMSINGLISKFTYCNLKEISISHDFDVLAQKYIYSNENNSDCVFDFSLDSRNLPNLIKCIYENKNGSKLLIEKIKLYDQTCVINQNDIDSLIDYYIFSLDLSSQK